MDTDIEIQDNSWSDSMIQSRDRYKESQERAKRAKALYYQRVDQTADGIRESRTGNDAMEQMEGETRPPWMADLIEGEHSALVDLANIWRQRISEVVDLRLQFLIEYPDAFGPDNIQQQVGHLTAVNVAKKELCKVTGRVLDHMSWRALPQRGFGELPTNWNRSTMVDQSHYGQHYFPSTSPSPTRRARQAGGRRLIRTD